ncbi:MAG: hypothetical protein QOJ19_1574 [Acidimicrobiia bacterium]|jgi:hypothetical protein|nr:hypothetical protein [Acidimicrobiia bacterium]
MPELSFDVLDAYPDVYGTDPTMLFKLRIAETTADPIHTMVVRVQIQIDAQLRRYSDEEKELLGDLFGNAERWGDTLRPFNWTHTATMLQGFRGSTEVDLRVPCTYDFEVAAAKYFHGLRDGNIPLSFLFSGTVISRGATGYSVTQIPWHKECTYPLPVATWRALMDTYWPGGGWIRLRGETLDRLQLLKTKGHYTDWDSVLGELLERAAS